MCLVASGGHSHIVRVDDYGSYTLLGQTTDDAAGEAFDKAARVIGIPYPGGPLLDKLAEQGDDQAYHFPRAHVKGKYDYSFSGVKTAVINETHRLKQMGQEIRREDFAASFRRAVVDMLVEKAVAAAVDSGAGKLALSTLKEICSAVRIPVVAIGGIEEANLESLAGTGIAGAAVVSAIFAQEDKAAAVKHLLRLARKAAL